MGGEREKEKKNLKENENTGHQIVWILICRFYIKETLQITIWVQSAIAEKDYWPMHAKWVQASTA